MELKAVFFDVGITLVYPHPSFAELFAETVRSRGHPMDPAVVHEALAEFGSHFVDASKEGNLWSTSTDRSRTFWLGLYRESVRAVGAPEEAVDELAEALYRTFAEPSKYRLHPDVLPTLEGLEKRGLKLAVISNFEEWLEQLLETLDVTRFFPVRVISGVEGVEKPDPKIFHLALERVGVEPSASAYVGDNPYFDVESAREVGMLPVLIDRQGRYPDVDCIRITSMEDLPEALGLEAR
jgi:putative hydrolase of the HAD superfamily